VELQHLEKATLILNNAPINIKLQYADVEESGDYIPENYGT